MHHRLKLEIRIFKASVLFCGVLYLKFFEINATIPRVIETIKYLLDVLCGNVIGDGLEEEDHLRHGQHAAAIGVDTPEELPQLLQST